MLVQLPQQGVHRVLQAGRQLDLAGYCALLQTPRTASPPHVRIKERQERSIKD